MESSAIRALLADTIHHERLAAAAARRLTSSNPARTAGHAAQQRGRSLPTILLLLVATLIRSIAS